MPTVFAPSRCGLPGLPSRRADRLVPDCRVPASPPRIADCLASDPYLLEGALAANRRKIFARITAVAENGGVFSYGWLRLLLASGGGWADDPAEFGTADPAGDPAYERGNSGAVPIGTPVELTRGYLDRDWRFSRGGGGCPDTPDASRPVIYVPAVARGTNTITFPRAKVALVGCLPVLVPDGSDTITICPCP